MAYYGMETSTIAHQEKVQKPTISNKIDAYSIFGTHKAPHWNIIRRGGSSINSAR